ncbi:hypothetical protein [Enterococcus gallinarum]|uniref:hypothetical protein n=1 Tax=Enterococcus gallinarum TaxID=1353 RepID=UPI00038A7270|nr:hypothetical protein [Enterococcus gallinarum]EQC78810.1 hypothetical protein HSIEG1_228 [Enterococcus sp. HSIEG1]MBA0949204.1 hypothetical protein [Enterococcus gallinarum]MBA0970151.1 hypothetical protein [Enterococcus gallinarum]MCD5154567.1 hypothetical protein [Enterococcus gallinarum]MCR1931362.1 hypothetical protein [Enterococcus gallinarum]
MFKTKINYLKNEKANAISVLQSQDSVVIEVVRGKNQLKFESVSNYFKSTKENSEYFVDLLFSYKKNLLYTVTDESYWCPTCERIIRKHYDSSSNNEIKEIMNTYRETMNNQNSSINELIEANYPILSMLPSGKYIISVRQIFPTFGESKIFSEFADKTLTASVDSYYKFLGGDNGHISVDSSTCYMLPTQMSQSYSKETLNSYREKEYLGRGLVINLSGFIGCLLDGHHKATIAHERTETLECVVIEPYVESRIYTGDNSSEETFNFNRIPTIDEFCYLQNFLDINEVKSMTDLEELTKNVVKDRNYFEDMEQLIVTLHIFKPKLLEELYDTILESYLYKDIRLRYFGYLATLERTETIEQLMLDFLINDDYENKQLTKLCEDYFR